MGDIISFTVMEQKNIGDVLVQDIQGFINLNPITLKINFPNFNVDNLYNIVLLFVNDVYKCWNFISSDNRNELKEILLNNTNSYYQEHWDYLLKLIKGDL